MRPSGRPLPLPQAAGLRGGRTGRRRWCQQALGRGKCFAARMLAHMARLRPAAAARNCLRVSLAEPETPDKKIEKIPTSAEKLSRHGADIK